MFDRNRRLDVPPRRTGLQGTPEGAVLERGEERVQFGQRGAVRGFQFLHGGDAAGEVALKGDRWDRNVKIAENCQVDVFLRGLRCTVFKGLLQK